jgi:hypothetical protein
LILIRGLHPAIQVLPKVLLNVFGHRVLIFLLFFHLLALDHWIIAILFLFMLRNSDMKEVIAV